MISGAFIYIQGRFFLKSEEDLQTSVDSRESHKGEAQQSG